MRRIQLEAQRRAGWSTTCSGYPALTSTPARNTTRSISLPLSTNCVDWTQIADPSRTWLAYIADGFVAIGDEEQLGPAVDHLLANVRAHTQKAWSPPPPP